MSKTFSRSKPSSTKHEPSRVEGSFLFMKNIKDYKRQHEPSLVLVLTRLAHAPKTETPMVNLLYAAQNHEAALGWMREHDDTLVGFADWVRKANKQNNGCPE